MRAKYVHTNVIARDWQALANFYCTVFGCTPVPPERDYSGDALDRGTGLHQARLRGAHFRLPGYGEHGPTIEIYNYNELLPTTPPAVNRPGFGHLAFEVDDVASARQEVLANGGSSIGEVVTLTNAVGAQVTWCYVADPEGNILELQAWASA
ncbi:MAG: VOC family protein [Roseiflexaceae bacterium]|nr:VOC family protein [Roseiflexaceae bacterium]